MCVCVCQICQVISEVSSTNQELLRKYKREMNLRKKCHNELVRLKGLKQASCFLSERFIAPALTCSLTHLITDFNTLLKQKSSIKEL